MFIVFQDGSCTEIERIEFKDDGTCRALTPDFEEARLHTSDIWKIVGQVSSTRPYVEIDEFCF